MKKFLIYKTHYNDLTYIENIGQMPVDKAINKIQKNLKKLGRKTGITYVIAESNNIVSAMIESKKL